MCLTTKLKIDIDKYVVFAEVVFSCAMLSLILQQLNRKLGCLIRPLPKISKMLMANLQLFLKSKYVVQYALVEMVLVYTCYFILDATLKGKFGGLTQPQRRRHFHSLQWEDLK